MNTEGHGLNSCKRTQGTQNTFPLRLERGESGATLAHRMGEGLGVRVLGEVSRILLTAD
jgi:hypothetical protein